MPKTKISEYSTTNADNTDIQSINIAEGCPPSSINDAIRELMVHLKNFQTGASADPLTVAGTFVASGSATINGTSIPASKTLADTNSSQTLTNKTISGSSNTITNISLTASVTGTLPVANGGTGITSLGAGVATFLGTPSSANLRTAVTDETGSGSLVFATSPTLVTPILGTPTSGNLSNCTADGTNSVGFKKIPSAGSAKTTSYTLATSDVGEFVEIGSGGGITIPNATFSAGDAVSLFNNTASNVTVTCSVTTCYLAGTNEDKATLSLASRGVATVLFIDGSTAVVSGNVT